ncbi:hypothetical protein DRN67_00805 [Candidatus Micrarchaeota archaeon]|nr:MAG: hypothetical protein DRN67_00805 [Candidatus Micrarchaeota archaeon]
MQQIICMNNATRAVICLILLLTTISIAQVVGSVLFVSAQVASQIVLNDLSITEDEVQQGETVSFSVTFENIGNAQTTATARVYIFNSSNTLIDTINYTPTSIAPNQQKVQIKSWNSNGWPAGDYVAKANVTFTPYNASTNVSNELSLNFEIIIPKGGGASGPPLEPGKQELGEKPVVLPPEITPIIGGPVDFVKFPVLKEVVPGQSAIQGVQFTNRRDTEQVVEIEVQGIAQDWIAVSNDKTTVMPGETRNMDVAISIPQDAQVGDYLVRVDAKDEGGKSSDFMVVRVKNAGGERPAPVVLRTVEVDRVNRKTTVNVAIRNSAQKKIERLMFEDTVPQELEGEQVAFMDKPGEIKQIEGRKALLWEVPELLSNEELKLSYTIDGVLSEYSPYVNWYAYSIEIAKRVDLSELVLITDLSAAAIKPGEKGQVSASMLYVGEEPLEVSMTLEAPAGFIVEPNYLLVTLQPRSAFTARFDLTVPEDALESQLVRLLVFTDDGQVSARLPIVVLQPAEAPPPSAALISLKPADVTMLGLLIIALVVGYLLYNRRRDGGGASFNEERLEYARSLKKLMKAD